MKKIIVLLLGLSLGISVWSQSDGQLVVLESQGKIKYFAAKGKPVKVISGSLINQEGTLKMKKGSSLQVLSGADVVSINQTGKVNIEEVLPEKKSSMRLGFSSDFLNTVRKTMRTSAKPPASLVGKKGAGGEESSPKTGSGKKGAGGEENVPASGSGKKGAGGEETPPPVSSGKKGAGGEETPPPAGSGKKGAGGEESSPKTGSGKKGMGYGSSMIYWNFPLKGNLHASGPIFFSWEGYVEGEGPWLFTIEKASTKEEVYRQETEAQYLSLTDIQARLNTGNDYVWRVSHAKMPGTALKAFEFSLAQENTEKGILEELVKEEYYQSAGPVQKLLWEAYAFEQAEFLNKADTLHKKALEMEPDNWLAVQMYRGFWARNW